MHSCYCIIADFFCLSDNLALWIRGNSWHLSSVICAVFCYIQSLMFVDTVRSIRRFTLFVIIVLQILIRKTILQLIWTKRGAPAPAVWSGYLWCCLDVSGTVNVHRAAPFAAGSAVSASITSVDGCNALWGSFFWSAPAGSRSFCSGRYRRVCHLCLAPAGCFIFTLFHCRVTHCGCAPENNCFIPPWWVCSVTPTKHRTKVSHLVVFTPLKIYAHTPAVGGRWIWLGPTPCFASDHHHTLPIWWNVLVLRHGESAVRLACRDSH